MENKVVVHLKDGTICKGVTRDFDPAGGSFHLLPAEGGGVPMRVSCEKMKALFYVRDYLGNRDFKANTGFSAKQPEGRQAVLTFKDGEKIWGTIPPEENPEADGFHFIPSDEEDNNVRIYVVTSSLEVLDLVS